MYLSQSLSVHKENMPHAPADQGMHGTEPTQSVRGVTPEADPDAQSFEQKKGSFWYTTDIF